MEITTQRDLIRVVAKRWRDTYEPFEQWDMRPTIFGPAQDKKAIALKLDKLDPETATPEDVAAVIGNESWTRLTCDECGQDVAAILTVGQELDYGSQTASICRKCAEKVTAISWENSKDEVPL